MTSQPHISTFPEAEEARLFGAEEARLFGAEEARRFEAEEARRFEAERQPMPFAWLFRPHGSRKWDLLLRATGVVAALCIPVVIFFPQRIALVTFALLSVPANGPLSPIIPVAFEPLIMEAAKYEAPIWVASVGLAVYMYMEFLNWHIYGWVLDRERLAGFREHRWVRYSVRLFAVHPFLTVFFFALAPLPFWMVRILALLRRYSVPRFMLATAIGRAPRLWLLAWVGAAIHPSTMLLVGILVTTTLAALIFARRAKTVAPADETQAESA